MKDDDNVDRLPDYEDMPASVAAIGLPGRADDMRIVINTKEERKRSAFRYLRPGILIPALFGAIEGIVKRAREHPAAVAAASGTALASASVAALVTASVLNAGDVRPTPTVVAERLITLPPPPPVTATITDTITQARTRPPPQGSELPESTRARDPDPSARSASSAPLSPRASSAPPSPRPTMSAMPSPTGGATRTAEAETSPTPADETSPLPSPTTAPSPDADPEPEPTPGRSLAGDCTIQVDLDPLLNLCVL